MNADAFNASVRSAYHFLKECQLVRSFTAFKSHNPSGRFRELSLTVDSLYRDLFLCGLRNGDYNLLLSDYAYFQFTHFDKLHYRLAYYPNPFLGMDNAEARELDKAVSEGVLSFEDYSHFLSDQRYEVTVPVIRFELDCNAYVRLAHPAAHFHVGMHAENRWPVSRCLTPRAFTLLIVKLYYYFAWTSYGMLRREEDGFKNRFDRYFVKEKGDCAPLGEGLFHKHEKGQLHFS